MKKYIFFASTLMLLWSCGTNTEAASKTEVVETENTVATESVVTSHENFNDFFADFQAAVKSNDKEKVRSMSVEENLGTIPNPFFDGENGSYDYYFLGEIKDDFLKLTADKGYNHGDMMMGYDDVMYNDVLELSISLSDDEEGSAVSYFFGKENGVYKLVGIVAAG